jgi:hypothetical protein
MHVTQSLRILSAGITLAALVAALTVGAARAAQSLHPADSGPPVSELRSLADHYRGVTWAYQRAARQHRTSTSFSYRRSSDRDYLRWTIDEWTRRAYAARQRALSSIHRKLDVPLPQAPALRAPLARRLAYSRQLTLSLRRIYPGKITRRFASAHANDDRATLRLWQQRSAAAALAVALHALRRTQQPSQIPGWMAHALLCIHRYEGAWTSNTGNGYYGGLQMDYGFMRSYGAEFVERWGTADNWPVWAQLEAAARAHRSGRGFSPWPNTARFCGLR